jgi:hypothetical protein
MNSRMVQEYVEGKFPGFTAKCSKEYSYRNSKVFILDLQQEKNPKKDSREDISQF